MLKLDKNIGSSFYKLKKEDKEFEVLSNHKVHFTHHVTHYYSGRNAIYALDDTTAVVLVCKKQYHKKF